MNLPEFLTEWPYGEIMVKGHRISLYHVIAAYKEGMNIERLHEEYPTLEPELIQKVLDFYHANQAEVDAYVAWERAEMDRQAASRPRMDWEALRQRAEERKRAGTGAVGLKVPPVELPSAEPSPVRDDPGFRAMESWIDKLLSQRGFAETPREDSAAWHSASPFWKDFDGDTWCLCHFGPGHDWFGVDEQLLRGVLERLHRPSYPPLPVSSDLDELVCWIADHPDLPTPLKGLKTRLPADEGAYLALKVACPPVTGFGPDQVHELINELVDAFVVYMEGDQPFESSTESTGKGTTAGALYEMTARMPDPARSPFHSFTLLAAWISELLAERGFLRENRKGSVSWTAAGKSWSVAAGPEVDWKLCYYGSRRWRFGVRQELVRANRQLQEQRFDVQFHVPPDTAAIFHGFEVLDNRRSRERIRQVIECV
jgi:uncharacterized protein (DUF433 family)